MKNGIKIASIIIGLNLVLLFIGYLSGADSNHDGAKDYFNNIDYSEQQQMESLKDTL